MRTPILGLALLLTICLSLAAYLEPRVPVSDRRRAQSAGLLETLMGDSRRLFATHFLLKADAYFHSGYYPGIFDEPKSFEESHIAEETASDHGPAEHSETEKEHEHKEHEEEAGFLGEPRDWIDRFSRHFYPTVHTHLDQGGPSTGENSAEKKKDVREMLPWLKLSAALDPNRVETYVVTAYWLRTALGKTAEAEQFLREGLRANPGHPALLFELGRIRSESRQDAQTARNLWELALRKWQEIEAPRKEPDKLLLSQIAAHLAKMEETEGNYERALAYWELEKQVSPRPEEIDKRIAELKAKMAKQPLPRSP